MYDWFMLYKLSTESCPLKQNVQKKMGSFENGLKKIDLLGFFLRCPVFLFWKTGGHVRATHWRIYQTTWCRWTVLRSFSACVAMYWHFNLRKDVLTFRTVIYCFPTNASVCICLLNVRHEVFPSKLHVSIQKHPIQSLREDSHCPARLGCIIH